jgi:methionyl-tRNA synthetase
MRSCACAPQAAILLFPVMPGSMTKLLDLLAVAPDARAFAQLGGDGRLDAPNRLPVGATLPPPAPIFPRYVEAEHAAQ